MVTTLSFWVLTTLLFFGGGFHVVTCTEHRLFVHYVTLSGQGSCPCDMHVAQFVVLIQVVRVTSVLWTGTLVSVSHHYYREEPMTAARAPRVLYATQEPTVACTDGGSPELPTHGSHVRVFCGGVSETLSGARSPEPPLQRGTLESWSSWCVCFVEVGHMFDFGLRVRDILVVCLRPLPLSFPESTGLRNACTRVFASWMERTRCSGGCPASRFHKLSTSPVKASNVFEKTDVYLWAS